MFLLDAGIALPSGCCFEASHFEHGVCCCPRGLRLGGSGLSLGLGQRGPAFRVEQQLLSLPTQTFLFRCVLLQLDLSLP